MSKLDLSGQGKASDLEIEMVAQIIFDELQLFDSPKDASFALILAHWKTLVAAFPPEFRREALNVVKTHCKILEEFINEKIV